MSATQKQVGMGKSQWITSRND